MKKMFVMALLLILSAVSFGQQITPSPVLTTQDYMKKNKHLNTAGGLFLGGGAALFITAMVIAPKDYNPWYDVNTPEEDRQYHFAEALALTGFSSMLASIPLFIAAHRNKKKSMSLSFKKEIIPQLQNNRFINQSVPSLSLKINL